ncbi:zinc ribbon domain-containing protein [Actinomadura litoris]|uniref:Uncharacterized protein n=1 Tax=Actinomadura litoris TaxID=2678616 RepID=A0A7K1KTD2_9ACTN|nr:zinc ribbon domain-containing protein [Actinomadura litoris]MUN35432.1 hypothetical protein [Actinomadura litoris]
MAKPLTMELLSSPLLSLDEIGSALTGLSVTVRISTSGVTHAPQCRQVGKRTPAEETMTARELRARGEVRPCRTCGGALVEELSRAQAEQFEKLVPILERRREQAREAELARREEERRTSRADAIDERASDIVNGWDRAIGKRRAFTGPAEPRVALVPCDDCDAEAAISFDPGSLEVSYACPSDPEHGFHALGDGLKPLALWPHSGANQWIALGLVAPVIAGDDDAWAATYGTRADDYRATLSAMEAFDRAHPPRLRLAPDVRCGDCGGPLVPSPERGMGRRRIEAHYTCDRRHEDGRFRHYEKRVVDGEIDWSLHRRLHEHPSWAAAAELEPDPEEVAAYTAELERKIALFDACAGAAKSVDNLVRMRARLVERFVFASKVRDEGALNAAGLTRYTPYAHRWAFSELARALLTSRVDVNAQFVTVATPFDEGTPLRRLLRTREIRGELADLRERQEELERELAHLEAES